VGKRRRFVPLIQVEKRTARELIAHKPLGEQALEQARSGGPGLLGSMVLHGALLLILALLMIRPDRVERDEGVDGGWIETRQGKSRENSAPLQVEGFRPLEVPDAVVTRPSPAPTQQAMAAKSTESAPGLVRPVNVAKLLSQRRVESRQSTVARAGGNDRTQRAIQLGLGWLARQQQAGGNWKLHEGYPDAGYANLRTDTGATAVALLAFLGNGHTHQDGEYREVVSKGLNWLIRVQKGDGDLHDHEELGRQTAYYAHSQATIVLCESLALTRDAAMLKGPAEKAVRFLLASQHPTKGGWKYQPQTELSEGDLSVTGWALMALHSARAAGIEFPLEAFHRASLFLDSVQLDEGAIYKYMPRDPADKASAAMTAEGLLCRQFLGWPRSHPPLVRGVAHLLRSEFEPQWNERRNVYEWYYTGQVLHNLGGEDWTRWYGRVQELIVARQAVVGGTKKPRDIRGSWHPLQPVGSPHEYADKAGRLYFTAMCLLVLELPFRHAAIYDEADGAGNAGAESSVEPTN